MRNHIVPKTTPNLRAMNPLELERFFAYHLERVIEPATEWEREIVRELISRAWRAERAELMLEIRERGGRAAENIVPCERGDANHVRTMPGAEAARADHHERRRAAPVPDPVFRHDRPARR